MAEACGERGLAEVRRGRGWGTATRAPVSSQETFPAPGILEATQPGTDHLFKEAEARRAFNNYGSILYRWGFRRA